MIELLHMDCMEYMAGLPDKAFELAIVDPPYGIDAAEIFGGEIRKSGKGAATKSAFEKKGWDKTAPDGDYFQELQRVSANQIIWGANYMTNHIPPSMGWIVWDKDNGTTKFSDCELAYSSFEQALRRFKYTWNGMIQGDMKNKESRIHPTQKPVKLYEWLLTNYAKKGDRILDTHLGSGSSAIAAHNLGFDFVGCELDRDYYEAAVKRFNAHAAQQSLFSAANEIDFVTKQEALL
jgi:site-specific DNA-methyltransferase (adenine-specific)